MRVQLKRFTWISEVDKLERKKERKKLLEMSVAEIYNSLQLG